MQRMWLRWTERAGRRLAAGAHGPAFLEAAPRARRLHLCRWISGRSHPSVFVLTYATEHLRIKDHFAGLRQVNRSQNELKPLVRCSGNNTTVWNHEPNVTACGGRCKSPLIADRSLLFLLLVCHIQGFSHLRGPSFLFAFRSESEFDLSDVLQLIKG